MDSLHAFTLGDVLREHRRSWPTKLASVDGDARHTYPELDARVNRLADALRREGCGAGDRVLWLGQNSFRVLEGLLAAAKRGAVFCPVNWRQSPDELAFVVEDSAARVVFWQEEEIGEAVRQARKKSGGPGLWLQHDAEDGEGYEALLAGGVAADAELPVDPAAPVLQMYTAAFSGRPGGAQLSHTGLLFQNLIMARMQDLSDATVFLNSGPLFHMATFMTTLATFHQAMLSKVPNKMIRPKQLSWPWIFIHGNP